MLSVQTHGQEAADHGIDPGEHAQHDDKEHRGADAENGCLIAQTEDAAEHDGCRIERNADVEHDGREDRDQRQPVAALAIESPLEEVGQGRHARPEVQRSEKQRQQNERERGHPLEVAEDHPVLVGRLGKAHQMDRRDIGREHGQTDHGPRERVARQKVVAALAAAATPGAGPAAQTHHGHQVDQHDRQIETRHLEGHGLLPFTGSSDAAPSQCGHSRRDVMLARYAIANETIATLRLKIHDRMVNVYGPSAAAVTVHGPRQSSSPHSVCRPLCLFPLRRTAHRPGYARCLLPCKPRTVASSPEREASVRRSVYSSTTTTRTPYLAYSAQSAPSPWHPWRHGRGPQRTAGIGNLDLSITPGH